MFKKTILFFLFVLTGAVSAKEIRIVHGAQSYDDGTTYEVGFCARPHNADGKAPGHAFVMLRSFDKNHRAKDFLTAGFSPSKSSLAHKYGLIKPEVYSDSEQKCLIVATSRSDYLLIRTGLESQTEYTFAGTTVHLTRPYAVVLADCVTFLQSVASDLGLNVPTRINGLMPTTYLAALIAAN